MSYTAWIGPLVIGSITVLGDNPPYLAVINAVEVSTCNPNNTNRFLERFSNLDDAKAYVASFFRPETHVFIEWRQNA